ncbi:MAG: Holliday junction resolvase RuvX [Holosporales bacterium]|jgi:putative Holliday junction resolvase|nr:Holliday junction resolvase RuvX [Holosporales bacterium]
MLILDEKVLCYDKYVGSRALCIDYGDKRIGIAISDITWQISSPFKVLESSGVFHNLFKIIQDNSVGLIVVGLPKALNGGSAGKQREKVEKFTNKLISLIAKNKIDLDVIYWDERLSTVAAQKIVKQLELHHNKNIDKLAASFILQGFLDCKNYQDKVTLVP